MPKRPPKPTRPSAVREPVQVYLAPEDSTLLASLALESGLAKAEIIRRSVRSYARTMQRESPTGSHQALFTMLPLFGVVGKERNLWKNEAKLLRLVNGLTIDSIKHGWPPVNSVVCDFSTPTVVKCPSP